METGHILIFLAVVFYFLYTLSFAIYFHRTADRVLSPAQKRINSVLLWLVPFLWIIILKLIIKPTKQNYRAKRRNSTNNDDDNNNWGNSWIFYFHGFNNSSDITHNGNPDGYSHGHNSNDYTNSDHGQGSDSTNYSD